MFSFVPIDYRSIPAEARADRGGGGGGAAAAVPTGSLMGAEVSPRAGTPEESAVAAAAFAYQAESYGAAAGANVQRNPIQGPRRPLNAIQLAALEIVHDIRMRQIHRSGMLENKEELIAKINAFISLIGANDVRARGNYCGDLPVNILKDIVSQIQVGSAFERDPSSVFAKLGLIKKICGGIIAGQLPVEFQEKMSIISGNFGDLRRLGVRPEVKLQIEQETFELLEQLKAGYSESLLELQMDHENTLSGILKGICSPFEFLKFLIQDLEDSYAGFIIHDILEISGNGLEILELLDLAFQNEKVREAFYKDGIQIIDEVAKRQLLTGRILEKFFLVGFDLEGKAGNMTLLDVIVEVFPNRDPALTHLLADFLDVNELLGKRVVEGIRAKEEGFVPRDRDLHGPLIRMVTHMDKKNIYQNAVRMIAQKEKEGALDSVTAQVNAAIGINQERPTGMSFTGMPFNLIQMITGADGYERSIQSRQAIAQQVLELRSPMHGPVAPPRDAGAGAAAAAAGAVAGAAATAGAAGSENRGRG